MIFNAEGFFNWEGVGEGRKEIKCRRFGKGGNSQLSSFTEDVVVHVDHCISNYKF